MQSSTSRQGRSRRALLLVVPSALYRSVGRYIRSSVRVSASVRRRNRPILGPSIRPTVHRSVSWSIQPSVRPPVRRSIGRISSRMTVETGWRQTRTPAGLELHILTRTRLMRSEIGILDRFLMRKRPFQSSNDSSNRNGHPLRRQSARVRC